MWRSLVVKLSMLAIAAGAVVALLWQVPPAADRQAGRPTSPDPLVVQASPSRNVPLSDMVEAAPDAARGAVASAPTAGTGVRPTGKRATTGLRTLALPGDRKLDLNRATQEEFERLPGIGPTLAKQLVDHRRTHGPYRRIEDLQTVKGIGAKRFERLMPFVTVSTSKAPTSGATRPSTESRES